jgi:hypothetical protein
LATPFKIASFALKRLKTAISSGYLPVSFPNPNDAGKVGILAHYSQYCPLQSHYIGNTLQVQPVSKIASRPLKTSRIASALLSYPYQTIGRLLGCQPYA